MSELKVGQHCKYFHYLPEAPDRPAGFVHEDAVFLGSNPNDPEKATIAFLNPTKLHLLQGSDWSDAFTRKSDVPREADGLESHHSWDYVEAPTDQPDQSQVILDMQKGIDILRTQLKEKSDALDAATAKKGKKE